MTDSYRVGGSLGTSIYDGPKTEDQQPIAMFFNLPVEEARRLAALTVEALNAPHAHLHWRVVYSSIVQGIVSTPEYESKDQCERALDQFAHCGARLQFRTAPGPWKDVK